MSNSFATSSWRECSLASLSTKNHLLEVVISYQNIEMSLCNYWGWKTKQCKHYRVWTDLNHCIKASVMGMGASVLSV